MSMTMKRLSNEMKDEIIDNCQHCVGSFSKKKSLRISSSKPNRSSKSSKIPFEVQESENAK